jgi:hypothetical protein
MRSTASALMPVLLLVFAAVTPTGCGGSLGSEVAEAEDGGADGSGGLADAAPVAADATTVTADADTDTALTRIYPFRYYHGGSSAFANDVDGLVDDKMDPFLNSYVFNQMSSMIEVAALGDEILDAGEEVLGTLTVRHERVEVELEERPMSGEVRKGLEARIWGYLTTESDVVVVTKVAGATFTDGDLQALSEIGCELPGSFVGSSAGAMAGSYLGLILAATLDWVAYMERAGSSDGGA